MSGTENGAERAQKSGERSGDVNGSRKKTSGAGVVELQRSGDGEQRSQK